VLEKSDRAAEAAFDWIAAGDFDQNRREEQFQSRDHSAMWRSKSPALGARTDQIKVVLDRCDALPDRVKCEELNVSKSRPLCPAN